MIKLRKIKDGAEDWGDTKDIWLLHFNYDGEGNALVLADGMLTPVYFDDYDQFFDLLFGIYYEVYEIDGVPVNNVRDEEPKTSTLSTEEARTPPTDQGFVCSKENAQCQRSSGRIS